MARTAQRGAFRAAVLRNANQQRSKAQNYGHLILPKGVNVFKEEAGGRINLDILPYFVTDPKHPDRDEEFGAAVEGSLWYRRPYKLHRKIGAGNGENVVCLASFGKKCPICEYRTKLMDSGKDWKDKSVSELRSTDRSLYYVAPKGSTKFEDRPYLWDISNFCFQDMLNNELAENEEFGDFMHPDEGLTLKIRFSEEKIERNSYAKTSRIDFEQRDYVYSDKVLRDLAPLDDCLAVKDYRELEALFYDTDGNSGGESDRGGGDVDEDRERTRREDQEDQDRPRGRGSLSTPKPGATTKTRQPDPEPEEKETGDQAEDPPEERRRPASTQVKPPASQPKPTPKPPAAASGKCPSGYKFGEDVDAHEECAECPVWSDCMDAKDAA